MRSTRHRRGTGRIGAVLCAVAPLIALAACSGSPHAPAAPTGKPAVHRSAGPTVRPIGDADLLASALVDEWTPAGYSTSPVLSGAEWASEPATGIDDDTLPGRHLLQVACSGKGGITVRMTDDSPGRRVVCGGKAAGFPFSGQVHAVLTGEAANTGRYAWRVLRAL